MMYKCSESAVANVMSIRAPKTSMTRGSRVRSRHHCNLVGKARPSLRVCPARRNYPARTIQVCDEYHNCGNYFAVRCRALLFGDIEGKLDVLRVECRKCARKGRYSVRKLIAKYGRSGNMMKWREQLNGDC